MVSYDKHLTAKALAKWSILPFAYQVQHVYDVAAGCDTCWAAIEAMKASQPLQQSEPFLRTLARVRLLPRVDLSLPSQAIRASTSPFRPEDFPSLFVQESISMGRQSGGPNRVATYLGLPSALAGLLRETSTTEEAGNDLSVNVDCAAVEFYLLADDQRKAEEVLKSARNRVDDDTDSLTQVNLMLAEFHVACSKGRTDAMRWVNRLTDEGFRLILYDPVRRFEISCEVARGLNRLGARDHRADASWALSELELGSWGTEVSQLNGLFYKARFATTIEHLIPSLPLTVASELEGNLDRVNLYGDYYSLGLFHQLLGELRRDEESFDMALGVYGALELEGPFFETWKKLDVLLEGRGDWRSQRRHEIASKAHGIFGKDTTQKMVRLLGWNDSAAHEAAESGAVA